jgi:hypothetical protein
MHGYDVCASHGGKAGEASKAIMTSPYDPVAAMERRDKRAKHRAYAQFRNAGQTPPPVKESMRLFEQRIDREQRAVRQRMETKVSGCSEGEQVAIRPFAARPATAARWKKSSRRGLFRRFTFTRVERLL